MILNLEELKILQQREAHIDQQSRTRKQNNQNKTNNESNRHEDVVKDNQNRKIRKDCGMGLKSMKTLERPRRTQNGQPGSHKEDYLKDESPSKWVLTLGGDQQKKTLQMIGVFPKENRKKKRDLEV